MCLEKGDEEDSDIIYPRRGCQCLWWLINLVKLFRFRITMATLSMSTRKFLVGLIEVERSTLITSSTRILWAGILRLEI